MPELTDEQKTAIDAAARVHALNATHPASWQWNEEAVSFVAPSDPPDSNQPYMWDEGTTAWVAYSG